MFDILLKYCLEKEVDNKELHGNAWKEISCTMGIDIDRYKEEVHKASKKHKKLSV